MWQIPLLLVAGRKEENKFLFIVKCLGVWKRFRSTSKAFEKRSLKTLEYLIPLWANESPAPNPTLGLSGLSARPIWLLLLIWSDRVLLTESFTSEMLLQHYTLN